MQKTARFNLKKDRGIIKADIGESIVKNKIGFVHRTRELPHSWLEKSLFIIPAEMKEFLIKHWNTLDLFKFIVDGNEVKDLELYEVKTRAYYSEDWEKKNRMRFHKPTITNNALSAYSEALQLGFKVKVVEVRLFDNWDYELFFYNFDPNSFQVHDGGNPEFSKKKEIDERRR